MRARGPVGWTCPKIDSVIAAIEAALRDPEDDGALHDCIGKHGLLEQIRSANDELRNWGAEQEDRADELELEVESLRKQLENAEDEVLSLKQELREMEAIA